jgi:hypothetical protein
MARMKWFALSLSDSIQQIADELSKYAFSKMQSSGFELVSAQKSKVRCKFIEEIISNEISLDPFGEEIVNVVRRFQIFEFQIVLLTKSKVLLEVYDPPRSLKKFSSSMAEVFGLVFSIEPLEIDILDLITNLKMMGDRKFWTIKKVRMSSIRLNEASTAKVEVVSSKDAYAELRKNIDVTNAVLDRATVEYDDGEMAYQIDISSAGSLIGEKFILDQLAPALLKYFAVTIK